LRSLIITGRERGEMILGPPRLGAKKRQNHVVANPPKIHSIHVTGSNYLQSCKNPSYIMSGDETILKRDRGHEFEEDGGDKQEQVQRSFRKHL